jgi:hypothetical protein
LAHRSIQQSDKLILVLDRRLPSDLSRPIDGESLLEIPEDVRDNEGKVRTTDVIGGKILS